MMIKLLFIPVAIVAGAVLNRARGTKGIFAKVIGLVLAAVAGLMTHSWWAAALFPAYVLGECWSWGHLIGGILKDANDDLFFYGLYVRGIWLWAPVFLVLHLCGCDAFALVSGLHLIAMAFPFCVTQAGQHPVRPGFKFFGSAWEQAEVYYGAAQGLIVYLVMVTA
jgi:hypothetical protein